MKKSFHVFFLFVLFAFFAVNAAWAATLCPDPLQEDSDGCYVNMPKTGTNSVNITAGDITNGLTSFKVYDDGGKSNDYSPNANGYLELTVPEGQMLLVTGRMSIDGYGNTDNLTVFDGDKDGEKIADAEYGVNENILLSTSGNKLTLYLRSDSWNSKYGLDLSVTIVSPKGISVSAPASGGSVLDYDKKAVPGSWATLSVEPVDGYLLKDVLFTDAIGNPIEVKVLPEWYSNKAGFIMPNMDVIATPVFTDNLSAEGGLYVNMPKTGNLEISIPSGVTSFKLYDDGGKDGNFTLHTNESLVMTAPAGRNFMVSSVYINSKARGVRFYDGNTSGETLLAVNYEEKGIEFVSSSNVLSLTFDGTVWDEPLSGFEFTVTVCSSKNISVAGSVDHGTAASVKPSAMVGEVVDLTANPESGYWLAGVEIVDAERQSVDAVVDVDWWSSTSKNTAKIIMPNADIVVTPVFTNEFSAEGGLYINMPKEGMKNVSIPSGVTSFKVYDDGGKDKNYSYSTNGKYKDGYLVLTAPVGYMFQVSGTLIDGWSSSLTIYDGDTQTKKLVANASANNYASQSGTITSKAIGPLVSTGNMMTIQFTTQASGYPGFDLTVNLVESSEKHSVSIADAEHGTVIGENLADVAVGEEVSLTVTPDDGYVLKELVIEGCESNPLSYSGGWYSDNKFTFVMPGCNVSVTPAFEEGVEEAFFNMDQKFKVVELPANVTTFKIYDDGGKNAVHNLGVRNYLEMIAPEGYQLKLTGSITTGENCAKLTVFDGDVNADKLLNEKTSSHNQEKTDIGILYSSGNVMTLYFDGGSSTKGPGLDLEVSLLKSSFGAVNIAYSAAGATATINGDYAGKDALDISEAIEVDAVDYNRELEVDVPVTALLPVTFYTLEKVEQVEGMKWQATMKYIGDGNLPQPNTPYAVILPKGQSELKFDLPSGKKATVQTGDINKVCGVDASCKLDKNGKITDDWFFTGTYAYKEWKEDDEELGLAYAFSANDNPGGAAKGKFGKIKIDENSSEYPRAKAMRCYLRKRDANVKLQQQNQAQMVAASPYVVKFSINNLPETIDVEFVKDDAKGGRTVLHGRMNTVTGEFKMLRDYDLKGRKVNSTNRARGAYYGKKVMKK